MAAEREIIVEKQCYEPVIVPADAPRIRQVFADLLDKALKYTPRGGRVAISAGWTADEAVVSFRDNGPGIAPVDLPRIWDRSTAATKPGRAWPGPEFGQGHRRGARRPGRSG